MQLLQQPPAEEECSSSALHLSKTRDGHPISVQNDDRAVKFQRVAHRNARKPIYRRETGSDEEAPAPQLQTKAAAGAVPAERRGGPGLPGRKPARKLTKTTKAAVRSSKQQDKGPCLNPACRTNGEHAGSSENLWRLGHSLSQHLDRGHALPARTSGEWAEGVGVRGGTMAAVRGSGLPEVCLPCRNFSGWVSKQSGSWPRSPPCCCLLDQW